MSRATAAAAAAAVKENGRRVSEINERRKPPARKATPKAKALDITTNPDRDALYQQATDLKKKGPRGGKGRKVTDEEIIEHIKGVLSVAPDAVPVREQEIGYWVGGNAHGRSRFLRLWEQATGAKVTKATHAKKASVKKAVPAKSAATKKAASTRGKAAERAEDKQSSDRTANLDRARQARVEKAAAEAAARDAENTARLARVNDEKVEREANRRPDAEWRTRDPKLLAAAIKTAVDNQRQFVFAGVTVAMANEHLAKMTKGRGAKLDGNGKRADVALSIDVTSRNQVTWVDSVFADTPLRSGRVGGKLLVVKGEEPEALGRIHNAWEHAAPQHEGAAQQVVAEIAKALHVPVPVR